MTEVAYGIRRVTNGVSNWYLVSEGRKITVVDAGKPSDWQLLVRELDLMHLSLSAVDCVLLTHAHSDHTGFAEHAFHTSDDLVAARFQRNAHQECGNHPQRNADS